MKKEKSPKKEKAPNPSSKTRFAPEGKIWVCMVCGKTAKDKYGMEGPHSKNWDESCMLNSVLVDYIPELPKNK
jgi:hypothetical protein